MVSLDERFVGCMLGGAVGDALGAPVEFLSRAEGLRTEVCYFSASPDDV